MDQLVVKRNVCVKAVLAAINLNVVDVIYTITREGDKLFGQRTGRSKEELLPLCVDIFYRKGAWRGEKVFERDTQGRVIKLLDRRENNDLVWKRISDVR